MTKRRSINNPESTPRKIPKTSGTATIRSTIISGESPGSSITTSGESTRVIHENAFITDSVSQLQNASQRTVLDIVDKLRRTGLNGTIELPQLIVVGDQSSGKSSVLEAITEIPFPRDEGLCTRFATTIQMRRDCRPFKSTIGVRIIPDKRADELERKRLSDFTARISDFSMLPSIIGNVEEVMGLSRKGDLDGQTFSRHVLSVEITGPDRPALTLVDLPGLIHVSRGAGDKELVLEMVKEYMQNERSIILAVVSGRNDWNNQLILDLVQEIDKGGKRTLGIITKPDTIAEREVPNWIDLARNKLHIYLERGWHVLRNRGPEETEHTFQQRNKAEDIFFSKGKFAVLPRDEVGIVALRERLSTLLFEHLMNELPSVKAEMKEKLQATESEYEQLGEKRTTTQEQQTVLMNMAMVINTTLRSAITGHYTDSFFQSVDMESAPDSDENITRFRAVVQHLNLDFAGTMRRQGAKFTIVGDPEDDDADAAEDALAQKELAALGDEALGSHLPKPKTMSRKDAIQRVQKVLVRSRGSELVGNFNPTLIGSIFQDMSGPWELIATEHIGKVYNVLRQFIYKVIERSAPAEFKERLASIRVEKALRVTLERAKAELHQIVLDKQGQPMTYCHNFVSQIQRDRQRKHAKVQRDATKASTVQNPLNYSHRGEIDPLKLTQAMAKSIEQDMDKFSAEEALDTTKAFYKDNLQYFINVVATQVVERHLVRDIPDLILSPIIIAGLTPEEIHYVAAEARETIQRRAHLEERKAMLEKGLETFREAMGALKR